MILIDIDGTPHIVDNDTEKTFDVLAKSTQNRFFVMSSGDRDLFNPLDTSINIFKRDFERGEKFWQLRSCSKKCYEQYIIFLRSKSKTPYVLAQRRLRNGF